MQINPSSPNFTSRNAYIRRADDIVRKVRNEFPMFSPTSAWDNWNALKKTHHPRFSKAKNAVERYTDVINDYRKNTTLSKDTPCFIDIFEQVQQTKAGNCGESSILTLGTLFANGYYGIKITPAVEIQVINKKGQDVFTCQKFCDHNFVVAKMDSRNPKSKKDIVILDTWLGKTMSRQDALKQFKDDYLSDTFLSAIFKTHKELIKEKGLLEALRIILNPKMTYKAKMVYAIYKEQEFSQEEAQKYGKIIAEKFPQVVMDKK